MKLFNFDTKTLSIAQLLMRNNYKLYTERGIRAQNEAEATENGHC